MNAANIKEVKLSRPTLLGEPHCGQQGGVFVFVNTGHSRWESVVSAVPVGASSPCTSQTSAQTW